MLIMRTEYDILNVLQHDVMPMLHCIKLVYPICVDFYYITYIARYIHAIIADFQAAMWSFCFFLAGGGGGDQNVIKMRE